MFASVCNYMHAGAGSFYKPEISVEQIMAAAVHTYGESDEVNLHDAADEYPHVHHDLGPVNGKHQAKRPSNLPDKKAKHH